MARKAEYGRGSDRFLEYTKFIVTHDVYRDMPDAYLDTGDIQWEAPSNRTGGKYKDTYHKRREWWRRKAVDVGVDPNEGEWLSKTAKLIHPTKEKPCKKCGRVLDIRYAYPSKHLVNRLQKLGYVDDNFLLDPLEHIMSLVPRLVEHFGDQVLIDLPKILKSGAIVPPDIGPSLPEWLQWIEEVYIPSEPRTLSPGAMANPPDRFDGFHSFNLCCRASADPGRDAANLQSYTTDRRVFEYWVEGDWIAADRMMGEIRSRFREEPCLNGHPGPCAADHIGPISLGFAHRPEFQLLCTACNSAKNNRMRFRDVDHLRQLEEAGEVVVSWYSKAVWDMCKELVTDQETALRLSKLLRDNRHTFMSILQRIAQAGHYAFLASLLDLHYADSDVTFVNLRVEDHITHFDQIVHTARTTRYATEQKVRRFWVAFEVLRDYFQKENRNTFVISTADIVGKVENALQTLEDAPQAIKHLDQHIRSVLSHRARSFPEQELRDIVDNLPSEDIEAFTSAKGQLAEAMLLVAVELRAMWNHERYVRATLASDD